MTSKVNDLHEGCAHRTLGNHFADTGDHRQSGDHYLSAARYFAQGGWEGPSIEMYELSAQQHGQVLDSAPVNVSALVD